MTAPRADLDELGRLLAEATPGPWNEDGPFWVDPPGQPMSERTVESRAGVTGKDRELVYAGAWETKDADAALIAALVNAAPALLAEVAELRETVARVEALADRWDITGDEDMRFRFVEQLRAALDGAQ